MLFVRVTLPTFVQVPFVAVQTKVLRPGCKPVTFVFGAVGTEIVVNAPPWEIDQIPVPIAPGLTVMASFSEQTSLLASTLKSLGSLLITSTSSKASQFPLVIVQRKVFGPCAKFVTPESKAVSSVTVLPPKGTVHFPVSPNWGTPALRVTTFEQTVWSKPAFAVTVLLSTWTISVATQPKRVTVHL